jgi:hypothetical protein
MTMTTASVTAQGVLSPLQWLQLRQVDRIRVMREPRPITKAAAFRRSSLDPVMIAAVTNSLFALSVAASTIGGAL